MKSVGTLPPLDERIDVPSAGLMTIAAPSISPQTQTQTSATSIAGPANERIESRHLGTGRPMKRNALHIQHAR
jgi:hypothetical protein